MICGAAMMVLAGCQGLEGAFQARPAANASMVDTSSTRLVERDVEAPDVFQKTEMGLWDGRPSLGGVWVAHPDVTEPERVIIRNTANSKFVIGALFKRERSTPGPAFQISSDAAAALGMLAGAPGQLNVTALRREAAPDPAAAPEDGPVGEPAPEAEALMSDEIEATALDPVAGAAAAAIATAEITQNTESVTPAPTPMPAAVPAPRTASTLSRPFIQIGIFSIEQNANNTATAMRQAGMVPTVIEQSSQGKTFWRVVVGPATSTSERSALLKKIKGVGFDDAYPVSN